MKTLSISHIYLIIYYSPCEYNLEYQGDCRLAESVHRRWTGCIEGLCELDFGAGDRDVISLRPGRHFIRVRGYAFF